MNFHTLRFHCIHNTGPYINYHNFCLIRLLITSVPLTFVAKHLIEFLNSFILTSIVWYVTVTLPKTTLLFYIIFSKSALQIKLGFNISLALKIVYKRISNHLESNSKFYKSKLAKIVFWLIIESLKCTL